jgi:hypothetical protein
MTVQPRDPRVQDHEDMQIGIRVRLSPLGRERSSRLGSRTGVVLSRKSRTSLRVLLDGQKLPVTLHESYIEAE